MYWENSAVDAKYIQQTGHVHLVAFAQMERLNKLTNKELCSNLTANKSLKLTEIPEKDFFYFYFFFALPYW